MNTPSQAAIDAETKLPGFKLAVDKEVRTQIIQSAIDVALKEQAETIERLEKALDAIYNHNEAARAAVIQHYGIVHPHRSAQLAWKEEQKT